MAYRCRRCKACFPTGAARANHVKVHDAPPAPDAAATRTRFLGSEPYDAQDYAQCALVDDEGGPPGEPTAQAPPPPPPLPTAVPAALAVEDEIRLRLCELKANGNRGVGVSEADMNNILRIVRLAATRTPDPARLFANCDELSRQLLELVDAHPDQHWFVSGVKAPSFPDWAPVVGSGLSPNGLAFSSGGMVNLALCDKARRSLAPAPRAAARG